VRCFVFGLARHALDPEFSMWVTAEASGFGVSGLVSGFRFGADFGGKTVDGEPVAIDPEAAQRREGGPGGEGMMPKILAGVNVADVHFNRRNFNPDDGVVQCDRGVRITAGVDDDAGRLLLARL